METKHQDKSPDGYTGHSEAQLREAELNTERCLRALDQRGPAGLDAELDRLYPPPPEGQRSLIAHTTLNETPPRSLALPKPTE